MPLARTFIDWQRPPLPSVADLLLTRFNTGTTADLGKVLVVVPGRRAARRLLELLVELADQRDLILTPPGIETPGRVPEYLYTPLRPFASDFVQRLAWMRALQTVDEKFLQQAIPHPPDAADTDGWLRLAELLSVLHRELAADGLDFNGVQNAGSRLDDFNETGRWQALLKIQQAYLELLDELGLWDQQTARLHAISYKECAIDSEIVLVGMVDMNEALKKMLQQVAERVSVFVLAPKSREHAFDEFGCLRPEVWAEETIDFDENLLRFVDSASDQAEEVTRVLADWNGRFAADEIALTLGDHELEPLAERHLSACNISLRSALGTPLRETAPYRLLSAIADFLEEGRFVTLAALVRHPDIYQWLIATLGDGPPPCESDKEKQFTADWLTVLDRYQSKHLPTDLRNERDQIKTISIGPILKQLDRLVNCVVSPLIESDESLVASSESQDDNSTGNPIAVRLVAVRSILETIYGNREFRLEEEADRTTAEACRLLIESSLDFVNIPAAIIPEMSPARTLRRFLRELTDETIPAESVDDGIECIGWLDLPLDDSPVALVTSFNEGTVPTSVNEDLFLPDRLRRELGVTDNTRRFARDAYATSLLLASRKETVFIAARRDGEGNPLRPTRLIFATQPEIVARRLKKFYLGDDVSRRPLTSGLTTENETSHLTIPRPAPLKKPIEQLSVTAFRDYISCPYRFYLKHVLDLKPLSDDLRELDAISFGNVIHAVLQAFGESDARDLRDEKEIRDFLNNTLNAEVVQRFGAKPPATIAVQREQARVRLENFARWQSQWRHEGWMIRYTERALRGKSARIQIGDQSMLLKGRIDRIDRNDRTDEWAIFDYKSGDGDETPEKVHRKGRKKEKEWIDLQLPLYRMLVRDLGIVNQVRVGFIRLSRSMSALRPLFADWTAEEFAEAEEKARWVVDNILKENFWPPTEDPRLASSEWAAICQEGVFDREVPT